MVAPIEPTKLRTKELKVFAERSLTGPLKDVLLLESDELAPNEFLAKLQIWLMLLHKEVLG
ncbi:MAG: hypothetical protein ACLPY5_03945 [Candidatus Bathyarchaeia archaeon]